jgi:hypothetical protein
MDTSTRPRTTTQEIAAYTCEHCARTFKRESALIKHLCEQKRRWQDRNSVEVQLALQAYCTFYQQYQPSQKKKDWQHFVSSSYYAAFVRFARYLIQVKCVNSSAYIDYVIKHNIKLDRWSSDAVYEQFLLYWNTVEDPWDAIKRSLLTAADWAEEQQSQARDYFRYATHHRVMMDIDRGRISAWLILCSESGTKWLGGLNQDQVQWVYKWIDPAVWTNRLQSHDQTEQIKSVLKEVGI